MEAWSAHSGEVDPGVIGLLRAVRRSGRRVALLSNATSRLESDLDRLGIADQFDAVLNSSRIGVAKPAPGIFLAACRALGVRPRQCAFVDDSSQNVRSASRLGMVGHTFRSMPTSPCFSGGWRSPTRLSA